MKNISDFHFLRMEKSSKTKVQFFRYLLVGGIATLLDITVFTVASTVFGYHYLLAQTFGFLVGITVNYSLCTLWIFHRHRNASQEIILFLTTGIIGLFLSYLLLWIFIDVFGITFLNNTVAKIFVVALVLLWNFASRKYFVFKKSPMDMLPSNPSL